MALKHKAVWSGSREAGLSDDSVSEFIERMHECGINAVFVHLKGGDGLLYWPSKRFPDAVAPGCDEFDLPAALLRECRKRGMQLHAWLIDFFEGTNGAANQRHPEWSLRNAKNQPTTSEILRGRPVDLTWMCPARRPGYTDQWLVPALEEFAAMYDVDSIHHDYIRYPGDMAPDQFCFCDYCLEQMPIFNGFVSKTYPDEPFYHELYDRAYLEAHWEQSPRVLPRNWHLLDRESKCRFLLEGSFFQGGRYDADYFFYTYRTFWVTEFAREAAAAIRRVKPTMRISAAVFKNPIHSGRFIGQDWRQFAPYVDLCVPMDYRDHYPGSFDVYLNLLEESIESQKSWARDFESLWIGAAINFLFFEEERPLAAAERALEQGDVDAAVRSFAAVSERVRKFSPPVAEAMDSLAAGPAALESALAMLKDFRCQTPVGYYPADKLHRLIDRIEATGVEGISLFCDAHLDEYGLRSALRERFGAN